MSIGGWCQVAVLLAHLTSHRQSVAPKPPSSTSGGWSVIRLSFTSTFFHLHQQSLSSTWYIPPMSEQPGRESTTDSDLLAELNRVPAPPVPTLYEISNTYFSQASREYANPQAASRSFVDMITEIALYYSHDFASKGARNSTHILLPSRATQNRIKRLTSQSKIIWYDSELLGRGSLSSSLSHFFSHYSI